MVEHSLCKRAVVGSSPTGGSFKGGAMLDKKIKVYDFDGKSLRQKRQQSNNEKARTYIEKHTNTKQKIINEKEEKRILSEFEDLFPFKESLFDVLAEIKENKDFDSLLEAVIRLFSRSISIQASRQGSLDEATQMNDLNENFLSANNLPFQLLNTKTYKEPLEEMVPLRSGGLMTRKEFKKQFGDAKNTHALKSFDGELHDLKKCIGYVFSKVVIGKGGHQDNVFQEAQELLCWFTSQKEQSLQDKILIFLIDYDKGSEKKFKELYDTAATTGNENIWVVNSRSFQEKIISIIKEAKNE